MVKPLKEQLSSSVRTLTMGAFTGLVDLGLCNCLVNIPDVQIANYISR